MNTSGIKTAAKIFLNGVRRNSPSILTTLSVAGVVTTAVLTGQGALKASRIMSDLNHDFYEANGGDWPYDFKDVIRVTWKCYVPAVAVGATTIGCIIGAHSVNTRRYAAMASVYSLTETAFREYQHKVVQTLGEKKERVMKDEMAAEKVKNNPMPTNQIFIAGPGRTVCFDNWSGRYFESSIEKMRSIRNTFNQRMLSEMWMSLNDMYYELGLPPIKAGEELGWSADNLVDFYFSATVGEDDQPRIVLEFVPPPDITFRD